MSSISEPLEHLSAREWLGCLLGTPPTTDQLLFEDELAAGEPHEARTRAARDKTGLSESVLCCEGQIGSHRVACAAFDFRFLGGSMGIAAGDRLTRTLEHGVSRDAVIVVTATGGTRVQEGLDSFLQIPRVMSARTQLADAGKPLVVVVSDPTMGGVAASVVATADIVLAEPGARLALSGPRAAAAIGETARVDSSEDALEAGLIDRVVDRGELPVILAAVLQVLVRP